MSSVLSLLPLAGCGFMMWFCMRGMRGKNCATPEPTQSAEIQQLRTEVSRLRAELHSREGASGRQTLDQ